MDISRAQPNRNTPEELQSMLSRIVKARKDPARLAELLEECETILESQRSDPYHEPGDQRSQGDNPGAPASEMDRRLQRKLFDEALDMIIIADADTGLIKDCNAMASIVTGWTRDELIGQPQRLLRPEWEHDQGFSRTFRIHANEGAGITTESQVVTKSGSLMDMNIKASLIEEGSQRLVQGVFRDVTQAKQDSKRLRELEQIVNMSPVVALVWLPEPGWPIDFVTSNARDLFGYSADSLTRDGVKYIDLIHPQDRERISREVNEKTMDPDITSYAQEYRIMDRDGNVRWVEDRTRVNRDPTGHVYRIQGVVWEVTERKQSQEALRARLRHEKALYLCSRELVRRMPDAIDRSLEHLLKASETSRVYIFKNIEDPAEGLCMTQTHEICAEGVPSELNNPDLVRLPYKNGFSRWAKMLSQDRHICGPISGFPPSERIVLAPQGIISILVIPIWVHGKWWGFIGFDDNRFARSWNEHDIRLLKTASEIIGNYVERESTSILLQESEERFRSMAAMAPQPIFETDENGVLTFASDRAFEMFGYEKESLERGFNILEVIAESDRARALEGLAARKAGEHGKPTEYLAVFEDGSTRPVLICSSPIFRSGVFSGVRGMIIDISERKRTERLEAQMEKYRAVADLSAGVAHNFNNMLQIIMGNAELARMKMETESAPEIDRNLTEITDICKFASKTVKRLNRFAAHGPMVSKKNGPNLFKLEEVARKAIEMTEPLRADKIRSGQGQIKISESLEKDLDVAGSQTEALEVIFNLIQNSIEATPPSGGHIHVSGWRSPVSAYLRVSDTGIGIPAKDLERIFTPFYTSSPDIGRGLGLATSLKIVRDMGGQIEVESSPGQGSSFIVSLPLAKTPCGTSEPKDSTTSPHRSLNILAVDDSESILTILEKGLTKRGHNVRKALSGTEGLAIAFESQPNIILCDMAMPDMDGLDFCRSLNSHYMARDLKPPAIIILSGLPDIDRLRPELQEQGARYILSKPVDFTELESILQKHSAD